jgi:tetratricopeptide (TPR) repeat protein
MISTRRRLEYASGYLELGLLKDAAKELGLIEDDASDSAEVLQLWVRLQHQAKQWGPLVRVAEALIEVAPKEEQGWVSWAYALRELERIEDAQEVLRRAEPIHGKTSAVLHYNLACYACLLGDKVEAKRRLVMAFKLDAEFKIDAADDPDLEGLRDDMGNFVI